MKLFTLTSTAVLAVTLSGSEAKVLSNEALVPRAVPAAGITFHQTNKREILQRLAGQRLRRRGGPSSLPVPDKPVITPLFFSYSSTSSEDVAGKAITDVYGQIKSADEGDPIKTFTIDENKHLSSQDETGQIVAVGEDGSLYFYTIDDLAASQKAGNAYPAALTCSTIKTSSLGQTFLSCGAADVPSSTTFCQTSGILYAGPAITGDCTSAMIVVQSQVP